MEGVLAILMIFGIPLSAIFSHTYLKAKRMQLEKGNSPDAKMLQHLLAENAELKRRLENVEMIVSDGAPAQLSANANNDKLQQQIYLLADEIKQLKRGER